MTKPLALIASFALQLFGRGMMPPRGQRAQFGGQIIEGQLLFGAQSLPQDVAHLRFGGVAATGRPALKPRDQLVIEISDTHARNGALLMAVLARLAPAAHRDK